MSSAQGEPELTKEDRLLAAVAHALVVASWLGAIGAAVIWALTKEKNRYVSFQAAQAAVYQLLGSLLIIGCWVCWTIGYTMSLIPIMVKPSAYPEPPAMFWIGLLAMLIPFGLMGLVMLYGLWVALRSFQGQPFRYLLIGPWLSSYFEEGE